MALILIVDDEPSVRRLLARWLQGAGHKIVEAESADAALRVMEATPAAVVFSDIQMPGHDGRWLTAEVRRRYPSTAVILATSVSTIAPQISMQAGVLAYLVKPFNQEAVAHALDSALAWHADNMLGRRSDDAAAAKLDAWLSSLE